MAITTRVRAPGRRGVTSDVALFAGSLALYLKTLSHTVYTFDRDELAAGASWSAYNEGGLGAAVRAFPAP
ncbi:MAG: hypothetical protein AAB328_10950 [candidate division NC10 bacterium]